MDVSGGGRGGLPLNSKNSLLHVSPLPPPNLSPVHSVWLNVPLISNHLAPLLGKHASLTLRFVCRACGASCTRAFATCETETKAFACPQSGSIRLLLWLADGFSTCPSLPWDRLAFECAESRRVDLVRLVLFGNSPRRQICALKSSSRVSLPSVLDVFLGLKFQRALQGAISSGDSATLWDVWCLHEDGKGGDTTQEGGPNTRAQAADGPRHALPNPSSSSPSTSPAGGIQMIQHIDRDTDASLGGMGGVPRVGALPSLLSRPGRLPRAELFRWLRHLGLRALRSLQPGVLRWLHRNCVLQYTREDVRRSLQVLDHATVSAVEEDELYAPLMKDFAHFLPVGASGGQRRAPPLSLRVAFAFLSGDAERVRQFLQSQSHENSEVAFRSKAKKLLRLAASGGFPSVVEVTLEWVRLRAQELGAQLGEEEGEEEGQGEGGPLAGGLVGAAAVILGQICADPSVIRAAASEGKGEVLGVLFDPLSGGGHPPFFAGARSLKVRREACS
uniref:Uncharacterized protein n=1 Tax=Chromera velia CCMP2878 TaxID=1169474 RepID=A0A0G4I1D1_9ALVE|eukprot:Cvel_34617.t1-p1 / transcript=Cvel_34617.t1 / gene=Cvel_34617 / organism=Chromera_velia_CCMP2878 / gene_product=hypothetical protein / transcript_product=hypothetical protein / location=Cvel_scaffold6009:2144-3751(+) / protein_length=502 / sequence_SO=supercontig / SO=protein_coding / is_pseudo=false